MIEKKIILNQKEYSPNNLEEIKSDINKVGADLFSFLQQWWNNETNMVFTTSGSTGDPKKILLSKQAMCTSAQITNTYFKIPTGITSLVCMPVQFIAGAMMLVRAMEGKYKVEVVPPSSNPFLEHTIKGIFYTACTPMQVVNAIRNENSRAKFTSVSLVLIGGSEISSEAAAEFVKLPNRLVATYGMTETITHVAVKYLNGENVSDEFHMLPQYKASVDDRSCLVVQAEHLGPPVVTNDQVEMYNQSFIWKGRWDNVINSGGLKFNPEELESSIRHLINSPFVISSVPDPILGNKLVVVLESPNLSQQAENDLLSQIVQVLHGPKKIHELRILGEFPVTDTGKINRKQILSTLVKK